MSLKEPLKLRRSRVVVTYSAADGYSSNASYKCAKETPQQGMLNGLEELARLTALFGFEDEAEKVFTDARQRVAEWKKENGYS